MGAHRRGFLQRERASPGFLHRIASPFPCLARIAAHIALSLCCARCVFQKAPVFPGILWEFMKRNAIFQAISDISEPVLAIFLGNLANFEPYTNPQTLDFSQNVYFSWRFSKVMNQKLCILRNFCNFERFLRKHPLKLLIFMCIYRKCQFFWHVLGSFAKNALFLLGNFAPFVTRFCQAFFPPFFFSLLFFLCLSFWDQRLLLPPHTSQNA